MSVFRCFLVLGLLVAVSACGHKKPKPCHGGNHQVDHHPHHGGGGGKCNKVAKGGGFRFRGLGWLSAGINVKLKIVKHLFHLYGSKKISTKQDDGLEVVINISRGMGVLLNQWVPKLGSYFQNMIMGSVRYIFCVMGSPWQGGSFYDHSINKKTTAPSVCQKKYGCKWGWRQYVREYTHFDEIDQFYKLRTAKTDVEKLIADAGIKSCSLKGAKKLIIDIILKITVLVSRPPDKWCRDDFILITRYMITLVAVYGKSYKAQTGYTIITEFVSYFDSWLQEAHFSKKISTYEAEMRQELDTCDRDSLNGAVIIDGKGNSNTNVNTNNNNNVNTNNNNNNNVNNNKNAGSTTVTTVETDAEASSSATAESTDTESSSTAESESTAKSESSVDETTTIVEEYEIWYDEYGNVINSTRVDTN